MGISGIGWGEVLIVLVIALLIFGTGKLSRVGSDLGAAIRGFRNAMKSEGDKDDGDPPSPPPPPAPSSGGS